MTHNTGSSKTNFHPVNALRDSRGLAFGVIIITALLAFEIFNYGTTDYALTDLLGELKFMGVRWATILAIAFCGIDFAGIARLFAPDMTNGHNENWFLFGAWLLAATMNAMLTWWGVSLAILGHETAGSAVIARETILRGGPVFVAVLVWLIRVLIIGTFSVAGDRLFGGDEARPSTARGQSAPIYRPLAGQPNAAPRPAIPGARPAAKPLTGTQPFTPNGRSAQTPASLQPRSPAAPQPHVFTNPPRRAARPPEPEYGDLDDSTEMEIIEPRYASAPLAARSANRPDSPSNDGAARPPLKGRRF
ncbi:MAG: hypothetical protein ACKOC5_06890 [Chloroflexota bacterium]